MAVERGSRPWVAEEYLLQVLSKNNGLTLKGMWDISKHSWSSSFKKQFGEQQTVRAFVRVSQLGEDNQLAHVLQRGFTFGLHGMEFTAGTPVSLVKEEEDLLVACEVYVGKSIYKKKRPKDKIKMPAGYDSIYILEDGDDEYLNCDFILYREEQVMPLFLVRVGYDPSKLVLIEKCCNCEKLASRYCADEKLAFCMDCEADHHCSKDNSIKVMQKHRRMDFKSREKNREKCPLHVDKEMSLFCLVCRTPLCILCKIEGHHFESRAAGHQVVEIDTYYQQCADQIRDSEAYFEGHKSNLKGVLRDIEQGIKQVRENEKEIEEAIYEAINRTIDQLKDITEKKLTFLICEQLEVKRRMERVIHLEQALNKQLKELDKGALVTAFDRFMGMREDFIQNSQNPIRLGVHPDIRLEGELVLMHEDFKPEPSKGRFNIPAPNPPPSQEESREDRTLSLLKTKLIEGPKYVIPQFTPPDRRRNELLLNTLRTTWDKKVQL